MIVRPDVIIGGQRIFIEKKRIVEYWHPGFREWRRAAPVDLPKAEADLLQSQLAAIGVKNRSIETEK